MITVQVEIEELNKLIATKEELRLLKSALGHCEYSPDYEKVKSIFNISKEDKNE